MIGFIILLVSWFLSNAGNNQIFNSTPDLELLDWISNGILDLSSWKSLWLNMSETDLHTPRPNQTCCFSYIPFLGNWPHHPLSNTSQMLGVTWALLSLPLPTTQQSSLPIFHGPPPFPLPQNHLGSPSPLAWTLQWSSSSLSLGHTAAIYFFLSEKVYTFGAKLNFLKNIVCHMDSWVKRII